MLLHLTSCMRGPCRTCTEAAAQARAALRRYRDAVRQQPAGDPLAAAGDAGPPPALPRRLRVRLPLPSPERGDDSLQNYSQGDWPGGVIQRFRRLRPLVEDAFLAGYDPQARLASLTTYFSALFMLRLEQSASQQGCPVHALCPACAAPPRAAVCGHAREPGGRDRRVARGGRRHHGGRAGAQAIWADA